MTNDIYRAALHDIINALTHHEDHFADDADVAGWVVTRAMKALESRQEQPAEQSVEDAFCIFKADPLAWSDPALVRERYQFTLAASALSSIVPASEDKPVAEVDDVVGTVDWISFVPPVGTPLYTRPAPADQDARDAARYRWLSGANADENNKLCIYELGGILITELDDYIDAAIERAGEKK